VAESTLSLTRADLREEIGYTLGYGRTSGSWTAGQQADIDSCLESGLRQFYYPPNGHEWTFLRPTTTLTTAADDDEYDLPDDFGSLEGDLTWQTEGSGYCSIPIVGEGQVRALRQGLDAVAGKPTAACVRPKAFAGTSVGQRFELFFDRPFDGTYTLEYQYRVLPPALSASIIYPYGGAAHAETILASCLAVAEQRIDAGNGRYKQEFAERLQASVAADNRNRPAFVGYVGDGTRRRNLDQRWVSPTAYYNGNPLW
jgi:hypothetical protein